MINFFVESLMAGIIDPLSLSLSTLNFSTKYVL